MTRKEVDRVVMVKKIKEKQISQVEAAKQIGISDRQMRRLYKAYKEDGESGLVSKKRGKPSNRRISQKIMKRVEKLICKNYRDFGPTLAKEKLEEKHGIRLSAGV